jgi:hypothetical protein
VKTPHTTIRMGAAHWDASIPTSEGAVLHFDFRGMTKDERRQFHAAFMSAYRQVNPMRPRKMPINERRPAA